MGFSGFAACSYSGAGEEMCFTEVPPPFASVKVLCVPAEDKAEGKLFKLIENSLLNLRTITLGS